jgi:putative ABC transport system permease protein
MKGENKPGAYSWRSRSFLAGFRRGASRGDAIWQDVRFGLRMLRKNPGFTTAAVFTFALGIGASTAIFSVVNPLWFNPVAAAEPDRLVYVRHFDKVENKYWPEMAVSPVILQELRAQRDYFADLTRWTSIELLWENAGWIESVFGARVSPNFFSFWSAKPWLGRTFAPDEGRPSAPPVIVISHAFWMNQLGGDPGWVGKPLRFGTQYLTVIGVMPPHFSYPNFDSFWIPGDDPLVAPADKDGGGFRCRHEISARLAPGVSMKQAQAVLDVLVQRHVEGHRQSGQGTFFLHLRPVREMFASAEVRKTIPGFVGAMVFILLIACANVANLNLARTETRQHELAIRGALGAGRFQLLRQLLVESLLPALAGAVMGLVLTYWSLGLLEWLLAPEVLRMRAIELDWQVLAYSLLIAVTAGLASGTVPAWYGATRPVANALKQSGVQATSGGFRNLYRRGLVVLEVSLAMVLLAGAGLMIQSVFRLLQTNLGFDPTNLIDVEIQPRYDSKTYRTPEANNFLLEEVHRRLSAVPGVEAVGIVQKSYGQGKYAVTRQGNPVDLNWNTSEVGTADAFKALRVRLLGGRFFEKQDLDLGTNATAVLVNQSLARRCWPGESAVGKTLHSTNSYEPSTLEVVGIVADTRRMGYGFLLEPILPMFYRPRQAVVDLGGYAAYDLLVRTRTKPEGLIKLLLAELKAAGPELRKPTVTLVKDDFYASTREHRTYMWQLAAFGAVGLLLATVGVYAILAHSVALREREIGIRMALGAGEPGVLRMVLREGMTLVVIGIGLGLVAACALTRLLRSMLYGVSPMDPLTFTAGALLISLIALLACYVPARRAAKVDPMVALRCE